MRKLTLLFGLLLTLGSLHAQEKGQFMLQAEANAGVLFHDLLKDNRKVHPEVALGAVFGYQVGNHLSIGIGANVRQTSDVVTWLPVFASAKYRFNGSNVKPFVEARCGYAFCLLGLGYKGSSYVSSALCEGFMPPWLAVVRSDIPTSALVCSSSISTPTKWTMTSRLRKNKVKASNLLFSSAMHTIFISESK